MSDAALTYEPFRTNRQKARRPKLGEFWCWKCDAQRVACGRKCPSCGARPEQARARSERI